MMVIRERVIQALEDVFDPELGLSVVALGLIYDVVVSSGSVRITMTLTTPGCPIHATMHEWVRQAVRAIPGVEAVDVTVTFDPPWTPDRMRLEATR